MADKKLAAPGAVHIRLLGLVFVGLGIRRRSAYSPAMDDTAAISPQDPPQTWCEALDRADADLTAGRTVPWAEVRARLAAMQDEIEAAPTRQQA